MPFSLKQNNSNLANFLFMTADSEAFSTTYNTLYFLASIA